MTDLLSSVIAAHGGLDWLNRVVAIGVGHRRADGPIYSIFEVL